MFEIIDNKGTIYSGSLEEMNDKFAEMIGADSEESWEGDLKLIQVIEVYK